MTNETISLIIRTFNEERWIGKCIDKIKSQKIEKKLEIIVVDSGSTDRTTEIASEKGAKIISVNKKKFSYGKSLNKGMEEASGKHVVFISAHCIPKSVNWLNSLISCFKGKVAAVYGPQFPHPDSPAYHRRRTKLFLGNKKKIEKNENTHYSNSNGSIRRDLWKKEKFDEKLCFSEDKKWAINYIKKGFVVVYAPGAGVYHYHNFNIKEWFKRNYNMGRTTGKTMGPGYYFLTRFFSMARNTLNDYLYPCGFKEKMILFVQSPVFNLVGFIGKSLGKIKEM